MNINVELLVEQIAYEDNKKSFQQFFLYYYDVLYGFAFSFLQNREASEEVISDVFLKIWQKRKTLPNIQNIKVYMYVAVKNQAINYQKKYNRNPLLSVDEVQPISDWLSEKPDSRLLTEELKKEIDDAIDGLPSQCKLIFQLVRIDGFKYKEVAEILNISVKTVENQVGIAIKKLAKKLHHLQDNKTPIPKKKEIKT